MMDLLERQLRAEIERLQEAKRRALAIADERSKENVLLRKALEEIKHRALAYVSDEDAVEWCHSIHDLAKAALADVVGTLPS